MKDYLLTEEDRMELVKLFYKRNNNYGTSKNLKKELIKEVNVIEKIVRAVIEEKETDEGIKRLFLEYCKKDSLEITREFLLELEKRLGYEINRKEYYKIFSYILILINFDQISKNKEMLIRKFMVHTVEYLVTEEIMKKILKERGISRELSENTLIQITDAVLGITLNNFKNGCFEYWINEDAIVDDIVDNISNEVKTDLREDKILHNSTLHHIKLAVHRIKNNINIMNSVYKELILVNDKIIEVVRRSVENIEKKLSIRLSSYEIACIGFQVKSALKRNERNNMKKVILICGLGYGSSKILEESLKENYDLDIVDVLPYYMADDIIHNYRRVDLVISTVDLNRKYHIPVIKVNPVLKNEDFEKLKENGLIKSQSRILMSELVKIIEENSNIKNKSELVYSLKRKFGNRIADNYTEAGKNLKKYFSKENVRFIDDVDNWKDGIQKAGDILVKNGYAKEGYVEEMKRLVEEYGPYIIIEEGLAMPHGGIDDNVLGTGTALLIVREKVKFPENRTANIFFTFSARNKNDRPEILNNLFELVTKYRFIEKVSKMRKYEELEKYLESL